MTHSDDDGLVLPPRLAPAHVVICRSSHDDEERQRVLEYCNDARATSCARSATPDGRVRVDRRRARPARRRQDRGSGSRRACRCASRSARATSTRTACSSAAATGRRRTSRACRAPSSSRRSPRRSRRSRTACSRARTRSASEHTRVIDTKDEFYAFFTPPKRARRTRRRRSTAASR